jgi:hypothetical protein
VRYGSLLRMTLSDMKNDIKHMWNQYSCPVRWSQVRECVACRSGSLLFLDALFRAECEYLPMILV